jgi:hypothetical protein
MPAAMRSGYLSGVPAYARCWRLYSVISASASVALPSARSLSISASQVRASAAGWTRPRHRPIGFLGGGTR